MIFETTLEHQMLSISEFSRARGVKQRWFEQIGGLQAELSCKKKKRLKIIFYGPLIRKMVEYLNILPKSIFR